VNRPRARKCRRPRRSVLGGWSILVLFVASSARAQGSGLQDVAGDRRLGAEVSLRYIFEDAGSWRNLLPEVALSGRTGLGKDPLRTGRLLPHFGLGAGGIGKLENREDLARSLLLPGTLSLTLGVARAWTHSPGTRLVAPDVSLAAKVVPWRADTTVYRAGISGGLGVSSNQVFDAWIRLTRAVNAIGVGDRRRVLTALGGPGLWASDVSATAGFHSRRGDMGVFGTFGAYLFDSKFHVPPGARRVYALGVRKEFE